MHLRPIIFALMIVDIAFLKTQIAVAELTIV